MKDQLVLSIDDDKSELELIKMTLESEYNVIALSSAMEGLRWLEKNEPDLVLLDVELVDGSGYDICKEIRATPGGGAIPVIFLSGRIDVEDRIRGYSAGGDEYLTKPISPDELKCKIRLLLHHRLLQINLDNKLKIATKTAFTAMTNSSELGNLVKFTEECFQCDNHNSLTACLGGLYETFGLSGLFQFRTADRKINWSSSFTPIKPLEEKLLIAGSEAPKICSHGQRTLFNSRKITMLIKNMPTEDADRYGRLKDHLAIVLDVVEARLSVIHAVEKQNSRKKDKASNILKDAYSTMCELEGNFSDFRRGFSHLFQNMVGEVEDVVCRIGLSARQEQDLFSVLEDSRDKLEELSGEGFAVGEKLLVLQTKVNEVIDSM